MARFIPAKGPQGQSDYYLDQITGKLITKRQRAKILRMGLSNETFAKLNKITNLELALSRPARGRASILKKTGTEKALILEARIEEEKRKKELAEAEKEARQFESALSKATLKTTKRQKVTKSILRPGSRAAKVKFNDYEEYLLCLNEAKALKEGGRPIVEGYTLGAAGFHTQTLEPIAITVFPLQAIGRSTIKEDDFYARFNDELEHRSYFHVQYYFMQVSFYEWYTKQVEAKWKAAGSPAWKGKSYGGRKKSARKAKRK